MIDGLSFSVLFPRIKFLKSYELLVEKKCQIFLVFWFRHSEFFWAKKPVLFQLGSSKKTKKKKFLKTEFFLVRKCGSRCVAVHQRCAAFRLLIFDVSGTWYYVYRDSKGVPFMQSHVWDGRWLHRHWVCRRVKNNLTIIQARRWSPVGVIIRSWLIFFHWFEFQLLICLIQTVGTRDPTSQT